MIICLSMAKGGIGSDWVFIGLGVGALIWAYSLNKPVKEIGSDIAGITGSVSTQGSNIVDTAGNLITSSGSILQKAVDYQSSWMDKLTQVLSPESVSKAISGGTSSKVVSTPIKFGTDVTATQKVSKTIPSNVIVKSVAYTDTKSGKTYGTYTQNNQGFSGVIPQVSASQSIFSK